jgi:RNA polymerase sigma factor (sigma-70 family)
MVPARTFQAIKAILPAAEDYTDRELLERYSSSGNEAAFAELVRRHGPMVNGTCRRITHNMSDADDAFQATFLVLARKADTIRAKEAVGAWLHRVAVRVAQRARQQALIRRKHQMAAAKPEAVHPTMPVADWWAVVDAEINQLPPVLRQVLLACDVGGQSRSQASRELGWPEGTVAKRLARGRQELANRLARRGVTLAAPVLAAALASEATAAVPAQLRAQVFSQATACAVKPGVGSLAVRTLAEEVMRSMKGPRTIHWLILSGAILLLAGAAGVLLAGAPDKPARPAQGVGPARAAKPQRIVWKEKVVLETPGWLPGSLVYSSDGKRLAVGGSGGKVTVFDMATGKPRWTADAGGNFAAVAFTADGSSLLATFRDGVRFLDPETGKLDKTIEEPNGPPDGRALAVGVFPDRTVEPNHLSHQIIWGTPRGYVVKTWIDSGPVSTLTTSTVAKGAKPADANAVPLAVDPKGRSAIMTGPLDRQTRKNVLWAYVCGNYEKGSPGNRLLNGHQAIVVSAAWSKDGKVAVTGDAGGRVIVWDARTMKETRRLEFGQRIAALALTADGRQTAAVVVGKQAEFYIWETAKPANNLKPLLADSGDYDGPIHASLAFSPNGRQLAGTVHNTDWLTRLGELVGKVHVWEAVNP